MAGSGRQNRVATPHRVALAGETEWPHHTGWRGRGGGCAAEGVVGLHVLKVRTSCAHNTGTYKPTACCLAAGNVRRRQHNRACSVRMKGSLSASTARMGGRST